MIRAALIDLDGTLLDTAPELAAAANAMLAELGLSALAEDTVAGFIGKGVAELVSRSLQAAGEEAQGERAQHALAVFDRHYVRISGRSAREYPGVRAGLDAFRAGGIRMACVTNKRAQFTSPLLAASGLAPYFEAVVTGDSVGRRKPHPEPFLHACKLLGVAPAEAIVVGDSMNDATAARAAGCRFLLVPYGYREGLQVHEIPCDGIVDSLMEAAAQVAARS